MGKQTGPSFAGPEPLDPSETVRRVAELDDWQWNETEAARQMPVTTVFTTGDDNDE